MSTDTPFSDIPDVIEAVTSRVQQLNQTIDIWASRHGITTLRYTLAIVLFWFGIVKPLDVSPADPVVYNAIFFLPFDLFFPFLGWWETIIGLGLLFKRTVWIAVYLMVFQMLGTMLPLITVPWLTFIQFPFIPSDIGAYIIKNWVLLSGGLVVLAAIEGEDEDEDDGDDSRDDSQEAAEQ